MYMITTCSWSRLAKSVIPSYDMYTNAKSMKLQNIHQSYYHLIKYQLQATYQHVDCYMGAYVLCVIQHLTRYSPFGQKYVLSPSIHQLHNLKLFAQNYTRHAVLQIRTWRSLLYDSMTL